MRRIINERKPNPTEATANNNNNKWTFQRKKKRKGFIIDIVSIALHYVMLISPLIILCFKCCLRFDICTYIYYIYTCTHTPRKSNNNISYRMHIALSDGGMSNALMLVRITHYMNIYVVYLCVWYMHILCVLAKSIIIGDLDSKCKRDDPFVSNWMVPEWIA